ncbi:MAG: O-linked N-acetylglucosamine transferase, SPINDLY family protein [Rhodospirillales bacterium]
MDDLEHIIETALILQRAGRLDEAVDIYQKVLAIEPKQTDAIHLLGMVSFTKKNYVEAISLIGKAISLNPSLPDYHFNITSAYIAIGDAVKAKAHAIIATALNPNSAEAKYNLGNALFALGDVAKAILAFKQSLDLNPKSHSSWANYLFALNFSDEVSSRDVFEANRKWGSLQEDAIKIDPKFKNNLKSGRRIRLGYYIPELDTHVTMRFLSPILTAHDKAKFEIVGYGYLTDGTGPPENIISALDHWVDLSGKTAAEIAELMRQDMIDILVHPCTFKSRYRDVLAHRAAPVQIACTNLVSTTGLRATDYLITDHFISPPNSDEGIYTEKLLRLSGFNTYQKFEDVVGVGPLPALEKGFVTFGSFNNATKLNGDVIDTWSAILATVATSRLLLKHRAFDNAERQDLITEAFSANGISEDRIIFSGFTPNRADYLSIYNEIDIALDPFPFGGGTVSYEALWMGIPVLTLAGTMFMGRVTGSLLHRLDLKQWVTNSRAEYFRTAITLARDIASLSVLRKQLRGRARRTIFDAEAHTLELETAFSDVWQKYCAENKLG